MQRRGAHAGAGLQEREQQPGGARPGAPLLPLPRSKAPGGGPGGVQRCGSAPAGGGHGRCVFPHRRGCSALCMQSGTYVHGRKRAHWAARRRGTLQAVPARPPPRLPTQWPCSAWHHLGAAAAAPAAQQQKIRIKLKSYWVDLLQESVEKIREAASSTGASIAGPVPLPTRCACHAPSGRRWYVGPQLLPPLADLGLARISARACRTVRYLSDGYPSRNIMKADWPCSTQKGTRQGRQQRPCQNAREAVHGCGAMLSCVVGFWPVPSSIQASASHMPSGVAVP